MRRVLTDRGIRALQPARSGTRYIVYDTLVPPFGVRVTDKGAKTFVVYKRAAGESRPRRIALGGYPLLSLEQARTKAKAALEDLSAGQHPRDRMERERAEEQQRRADSFGAVAEEFIKRHVARLRGAKAMSATIRQELVARWDTTPITEITRRDVVGMLEEIHDGKVRGTRKGRKKAGGRYAAHHAFAYTSKLFNWAVARDLYRLPLSPCDRIKVREIIGAAEPRQRVLNDNELHHVWHAAAREGYPFGTLVQLLLITGQRLNEVAGKRWSEIDLQRRLWTIPPERMKAATVHEVPLSDLAIAILARLHRFTGDYVFSTAAGERPISGFSKAKNRLDMIVEERRTAGAASSLPAPMPPWVYHDLRRTMRTHLSGFAVPDLVRELVIAHRKPGLHKVYDQHAYREEKREALQLWATALRAIVSHSA
jgi:integrase